MSSTYLNPYTKSNQILTKQLILLLLITKVLSMSLPQDISLGEKLLISSPLNKSNITTCEVYRLHSKFNKIGFHLLDFYNINTVMITSRLPIACNQCDSKAEICQSSTIDYEKEGETRKTSQFVNFFWKLCLDELFIIITQSNDVVNLQVNENTDEISSFLIDSTFYEGSPCVIDKETSLSHCAESSIDDCRSCLRQGCSVIECGNVSGGKFIHHFDICVSSYLIPTEKESICKEFKSLSTFNKASQVECDFDNLEGYSNLSIFFVFILVASVIVLSIVIVYYNIYLIKNGEPPFEPPTYFPIFLFPRESEMTKEENKRAAQNLQNLNKIFKSNEYENN